MKILCIKDNGGSKYHRLFLPYSLLGEKVVFSDKITEELVKDIDVLVIHYYDPVPPAQISIWKKKYGFKLIVDIDDTFNIHKSHIIYGILSKIIPFAKDLAILADHITVSTEYLKQEMLRYNNRITVIDNYLPYGHGQFKVLFEPLDEFFHRKIRVGLIGSASHIEDWSSIWLDLKRIVNDERFKANCEFVLCGYNSKITGWNKLKQITNGIPLEYKNPNEYMELYNKLDIALCPLKNNELNKGKSALKVYEAACTDTILILDKLYKSKGNVCDYHLYPDKCWYSAVMDLIGDKKELYKKKIEVGDKVRRSTDFSKRIEKIREVIQSEEVQIEHNVSLFSIIYNEEQRELSEYNVFFNKINSVEDKSYLFEYNPMIDIIDNYQLKEWTGIFSWKFPLKTGVFEKKIIKSIDDNYDIIYFCKPIINYLKFTEVHHPGFMKLFNSVCSDLGLKINEPRHVIYSNFFVARTDVYREYVNNIIKPAIELLETKHKKQAWADSKYKGLSKEKLNKYTGLDYYTMHTFILERLISVWIDNKKIKSINKI